MYNGRLDKKILQVYTNLEPADYEVTFTVGSQRGSICSFLPFCNFGAFLWPPKTRICSTFQNSNIFTKLDANNACLVEFGSLNQMTLISLLCMGFMGKTKHFRQTQITPNFHRNFQKK